MASCTSPRVSLMTLPISRVISLRVLFLAPDQDLRRLVEHFGAPRSGHQPPLLVGFAGGIDGAVHVFRVRALEDADHLAGVGGIEVLEGAAGVALDPLAGDEVLVNRGFARADAGRLLIHGSHYECLQKKTANSQSYRSAAKGSTALGRWRGTPLPPRSLVSST